ncbi:MAG: hypothetical protein ACXW5U_11505 [Thermoanaerobaculia bacterium]
MMRLVMVEWLDSYGCTPDWHTLADVNATPMVCKSVGWLIRDDEKIKVIAPHISDEGNASEMQQCCGDMTIPSAAVLSMRDLAVA